MPRLLQTKSKFWCAVFSASEGTFCVGGFLLVYSVSMARIWLKWWKSVTLLQLAHYSNELH